MKEAEKRNRKPIKYLIPVMAFMAAIVSFCILMWLKPTRSSFVYELGETVSTNPYHYVSGKSYAVEHIKIDKSAVDESSTGDYQVIVSGGLFQHFTYSVSIVDTTPPDIELIDEVFIIEQGKEKEKKVYK